MTLPQTPVPGHGIDAPQVQLVDSFGRNINYLRLSVTDRCNLRCLYCMPQTGIAPCAHDDILTYEELFHIAKAAVELGTRKIRLTGGEPLVRRGIVGFVARLAALPGLEHLAMSTNGMLLPELAGELHAAGLQRLNVSLDTLDAEKFARITRGGRLERVLAGLDAAEKAGFPPPKLNAVVMRGVNDEEILDFVELTRLRGNSIRFIEYMPTLKEDGWRSRFMSGAEILRRISRKYPLEQVDKGRYAGPSQDFRIPGSSGTIGVISPVFGHFCANCNRIRVTSKGKAMGCLFSSESVDLVASLRPLDEPALARQLRQMVAAKPKGHAITMDGYEHKNFVMCAVGG